MTGWKIRNILQLFFWVLLLVFVPVILSAAGLEINGTSFAMNLGKIDYVPLTYVLVCPIGLMGLVIARFQTPMRWALISTIVFYASGVFLVWILDRAVTSRYCESPLMTNPDECLPASLSAFLSGTCAALLITIVVVIV